jgi:hypothetical protein
MSPLEAARVLARQKRDAQTVGLNAFSAFNALPAIAKNRQENAPRVTQETQERVIAREAHLRQGYARNARNALSPSSADVGDRTASGNVGVPKRWAEGFAALSTAPAPTGFTSPRWQRIVDAAGTFLDRWAAEAIRCGWSDLDVFGCNPDRPDARFDAMGLVLLLDRSEIVGIDEHGADLIAKTGAYPRPRQRYRRRSVPADTVSLWDLAVIGPGRDAG